MSTILLGSKRVLLVLVDGGRASYAYPDDLIH